MKAILPFFLILCCLSCESLVFEEDVNNDPVANFDYLWQECNENYAFFDYKGINWDIVYSAYRGRVNERTTQDSLFRVLFAMLNELRDGHVNLISTFNVSRFNFELLGPENINERLVLEKYLGTNHYTTGPFRHNVIANGQIGYVRYASFSNRVSEFDMNFIIARYQRLPGLIIDLRQNGGGTAKNIFTILNRFAPEKTLLYNSYIKSGPGREDFDGPQPAYAEPPKDDIYLKWPKKVAVLVDRGTFSAGSFFALGALALPNVFLVGDTTGGGLGIPNGGQLPNGWTYRFSISRTFTPDGKNYENGVPPDIRVLLNKADVEKGIDTVIEKAVEELLK